MSTTFGSDPIGVALDAAFEGSLARTVELAITGFDTNHGYNIDFLREADAKRLAIMIVSNSTGTRYNVATMPRTLTEHRVHVVLVAIDDRVLDETAYRKLTLIRKDDGTVRVRPNWVL